MAKTKWPLRVAIVSTVIWVFCAYALSYEYAGYRSQHFSASHFVLFGLLPPSALWGVGWILAGVLGQRAERRQQDQPVSAVMVSDKNDTDPPQAWEPSFVPPPLAGPWRRFFARWLDIYVWACVVGIVAGILNTRYGWSLLAFKESTASDQRMLNAVVGCAVGMVCDVLVYAAFGTTLGKSLLGVKVQTLDGSPLPARTYAARNFNVWLFGLGGGIPGLALLTQWFSYRAVTQDSRTKWDIRYGCRVSSESRKIGHYVLAAVLFFGAIGLAAWGTVQEEQQQVAQNAPPPNWQNPISSQVATPLPAGWHQIKTPKNSPTNTWLFADAANEEVVGIGFEQTDLELADYVDALQKGVPMLAFIQNGTIVLEGSRQVWTGEGTGTTEGASASRVVVRAHVFGGDGGYWRVIEIVPESRSTDGAAQEPQVFRAVMSTTRP
ncbi:RDD family protein [Burkholderia pseudomallei]|uniref:RDD family protein n=1 Tax=Burkholderia pseudomallei TaxID=28450 RepID=UPI000977831F|nr:RDD family protein [Burkholderia pseudomallei]ONA19226.1 hypothetical protein AQ875_09950 [Burkholderia pseudomallei]